MSTPSSLFAHYQLFFEANNYELKSSTPYLGKRPLKLAGLPVMLPSTEALMKNQDECIIFHPIGESLIHTDSPTLQMTNRIINKTINQAFATLLAEVSEVASQKDGKINKHQRKFLEGLGEYKDAGKFLTKLLERYDDKVMSKRLINITVDADEMLGEQRYKRVARVTSPLLSFLDNWEKPQTIWGVKVTVKRDVEMLAQLIRNVMPEIDNIVKYSVGSNNRVSPNYISQLKAFAGVMETIRDIAKRSISVRTIDMVAKDYAFVNDLDEKIAVLEAGAPRDLRGNFGDVAIPVAAKTLTADAMDLNTKESPTKAEGISAGMSVETKPIVEKVKKAEPPKLTGDAMTDLFSGADSGEELPDWVFGIDNEADGYVDPKSPALADDGEVSSLWVTKPDMSKYDDLPSAFRPSESMVTGRDNRTSKPNDNELPSWA